MAVFFAEILAGYTAGSVFLIIVIISPLLLFFLRKRFRAVSHIKFELKNEF